jgi:hypothetical protein
MWKIAATLGLYEVGKVSAAWRSGVFLGLSATKGAAPIIDRASMAAQRP